MAEEKRPEDVVAERLAAGLGFEHFVARGRDHLDFQDVSITSLMVALRAAYVAGRNAAHGAA